MRVLCLFVVATTATVALGGCNDNLPVASFIDKLRVLAIEANPPEIAPGATTKLHALAVEPAHPTESIAPLSAVWLACEIPPGVSSPLPCGLNPGELDGTSLPKSCDDAADGELCILSTTLDAQLTPSATVLGAAVSTEILVTVAIADTGAGAAACLLDTARNGGLPTEPDHCVISIKRVTVRDPARSDADHPPGAPNQNPMLDRLDIVDTDATVLSLLSGDAIVVASDNDNISRTLTTTRDGAAAERKPDGTYEALSLSWFATGGKIDGGRSTFDPPGCDSQEACASMAPVSDTSTTWDAPTAAEATTQVDPDGRLRIWAVLRDDRGGVGWLEGTLGVQ